MAKPNELLAQVHPWASQGHNFLGSPAAPRLYFIVSPDAFERFKYQSYYTVRGEQVKVVGEKLKKLEQYVIKGDFAHKNRPAKEVVESRVIAPEEESKEIQGKVVRQNMRELASWKCCE